LSDNSYADVNKAKNSKGEKIRAHRKSKIGQQ